MCSRGNTSFTFLKHGFGSSLACNPWLWRDGERYVHIIIIIFIIIITTIIIGHANRNSAPITSLVDGSSLWLEHLGPAPGNGFMLSV